MSNLSTGVPAKPSLYLIVIGPQWWAWWGLPVLCCATSLQRNGVEDRPVQLGYAPIPLRRTRPVWLTILRASGVVASGIIGACAGWLAGGLGILLNQLLHWTPNEAVSICSNLPIFVACFASGIVVGLRLALRICRKHPQWSSLGGA